MNLTHTNTHGRVGKRAGQIIHSFILLYAEEVVCKAHYTKAHTHTSLTMNEQTTRSHFDKSDSRKR